MHVTDAFTLAGRHARAAAIALLAAVGAGVAAPAWAETAFERAACTPSVLQLCPREALTLNRPAAQQCLLANLARATPQCQAVVRSHLLALVGPQVSARPR